MQRGVRTIWICIAVIGVAVAAVLLRESMSPLRGEAYGAVQFNFVAGLVVGVCAFNAVVQSARILARWSATRDIARGSLAAAAVGLMLGIVAIGLLLLVILGLRP